MKPLHAYSPFLAILVTILVAAPYSYAQSSSLSGVVTDETGGVLPGVEITILNEANGLQRTILSTDEGLYVFPQLPPGSYTLAATQPGFELVTIEGITLLVNTKIDLPVKFDVEALTESVTVSAAARQLNTTDASVGNAFGTKPIGQLPLNARNPAGLLSLQAGVTFLTADPLDAQLSGDIRNGSVNGAQSDQSNVTLDGVDVNDQDGRLPFTSVLRNTLDSIQEFRVVTTTANADQGRSSGAQVSLVTKSGSNEIHGSLYEYHRNTVTAANDFFNNRAGVDRPKLIRNVFGASVGGPVKNDRFFYFVNYEGRRDASEGSAVRRVPTASMRDGFVRYRSASGEIQTLSPEFISSRIDPLGTGPNPATLQYFSSFPEPNDSTVGDGLNTAGFRFAASTPLVWNTFISKLDWNLDRNGGHRMFLRTNYQNDSISSVPQFPGQPPNRETADTSRGWAVGYDGTFGTNVLGTFRYGFTGQKLVISGVQTESRASLGDSIIDDIEGSTTPRDTYLPTQTVAGDFSVISGSHTLQFGGVFFSTRNQRLSYGNSFHFAKQAAWALFDAPTVFDGPLAVAPANPGVYRETMATALGVLNFFDANYNYDLAGNPLSLGDPVSRTFGAEQFELYLQDTWRVQPGLTVTAGLRWSIMPPVTGSEWTAGQHHAGSRPVHRPPSGPGGERPAHARCRADRLRGSGRPARRSAVGHPLQEFLASACRGLLAGFRGWFLGQAVRRPGEDVDPGRRGYLLQQLRDGHDADARPECVRPHQQGDQPDLHCGGVTSLRRAFESPSGRDPASSARRTWHPEPHGTGMEPGCRLQRGAAVQHQSHLFSGP